MLTFAEKLAQDVLKNELRAFLAGLSLLPGDIKNVPVSPSRERENTFIDINA